MGDLESGSILHHSYDNIPQLRPKPQTKRFFGSSDVYSSYNKFQLTYKVQRRKQKYWKH